jgi:glucokinase
VTELAHSGDPAARAVLAEIGTRLGYGLVGIINVFNPEVIIIGGGAVRAGELLLEPARRIVSERAMPPVRAGVAIRAAHFGDEAGMMGAALLAFEQLVEAAA